MARQCRVRLTWGVCIRYGQSDCDTEVSARVKSALGAHSDAPLLGLDIAATLLPIQTVGVQGDGRTYSYVCALSSDRCDAAVTCMHAWHTAHTAWPLLQRAAMGRPLLVGQGHSAPVSQHQPRCVRVWRQSRAPDFTDHADATMPARARPAPRC